ncbi:MAG: urea ABC transporter permease subunit UrtC [Ruegeria sp.]
MERSFVAKNPSVLIFLTILSLFVLAVTVLSEGFGIGVISTSFVKTLGKTLCLCLIAVAMDLVWGFTGILSLGHFAFFGLGGYMIGMWLMYERTRLIVMDSTAQAEIPPTSSEVVDAIGNQIFGVVGSSEFPIIWAFSDSLFWQLALVVLVPGLLALVFGWLAFRSRVTGVYLSILTQAMTLALALYLFQNDSGLRGNNGLSGLQNLPGVSASQDVVSVWFLWASALALALGYILATWIVSGKFGSVIRGIRDNEARVRFLGYSVETYKLAVFTLTACIAAIAGALYYPQAGIINPEEMTPIASIYLAVWVAIGGRGRLYGAVIGAAFVSLLSTWFTGGQAPDIALGLYTIKWVDWWQVLLGVSFVLVTLFAPQGIGGIIDMWTNRRAPTRHGANLGPDDGSLREKEATQ